MPLLVPPRMKTAGIVVISLREYAHYTPECMSARWFCSPAARIPPPAWPGRWTAIARSRPSASTTASATRVELEVRPRLLAELRERFPALARALGADHFVPMRELAQLSRHRADRRPPRSA